MPITMARASAAVTKAAVRRRPRSGRRLTAAPEPNERPSRGQRDAVGSA